MPQTEAPTIYVLWFAAIGYCPGIAGEGVAVNVGLTDLPGVLK